MRDFCEKSPLRLPFKNFYCIFDCLISFGYARPSHADRPRAVGTGLGWKGYPQEVFTLHNSPMQQITTSAVTVTKVSMVIP